MKMLYILLRNSMKLITFVDTNLIYLFEEKNGSNLFTYLYFYIRYLMYLFLCSDTYLIYYFCTCYYIVSYKLILYSLLQSFSYCVFYTNSHQRSKCYR